jgi:hypothetical protein
MKNREKDKKWQLIIYSSYILLPIILILILSYGTSGADTSSTNEEKGFFSEIDEAIRSEKRHIEEILNRQTDSASRNLIILTGLIAIPLLIFLAILILKFLFNISISAAQSLFNVSMTTISSLSKITVEKHGQETAEKENKPKKRHLKLGEILLSFVSRSVTTEEINHALSEQKKDPLKPLIGEILIKKGFATHGEIETSLKIQGKNKDK